jgi:glutamate synthase (NADPH/NADH) small chain
MGKVTGFLDFPRLAEGYVAPAERVKNYKEFVMHLSDEEAKTQGARCMDCGIPFCNNGCPVNNIIPDWNDLVYKQDWEGALEVLHSTNNFLNSPVEFAQHHVSLLARLISIQILWASSQ